MRRLAVPFLLTASVVTPACAQPDKPERPIARNPPAPRPEPIQARPPIPDRMDVPGGYIKRDQHDNCRKFFQSACPEGAKCNPPPPRWVQCPPELLNWAKPGEKVVKNGDGTCRVFHEIRCPEGATCNPPPPKRVRCPGDLPAPQPPIAPQSQPASRTFAPPPPAKPGE